MKVRRCFRELDAPVLVLKQLYQLHELITVCLAGLATVIIGTFLFGVGLWGIIVIGISATGVVAGLTHFFQMLRKGAPGHVRARLHRMGVLDLLPPGIRPRYLIPSPGLFSKQRFVRLMPVEGDTHGHRELRSAYFGK